MILIFLKKTQKDQFFVNNALYCSCLFFCINRTKGNYHCKTRNTIKKQTILSAYVSYIYIDNFVVKKYFSISLYNTQNTT